MTSTTVLTASTGRTVLNKIRLQVYIVTITTTVLTARPDRPVLNKIRLQVLYCDYYYDCANSQNRQASAKQDQIADHLDKLPRGTTATELKRYPLDG